jgi:hypothetical protein
MSDGGILPENNRRLEAQVTVKGWERTFWTLGISDGEFLRG